MDYFNARHKPIDEFNERVRVYRYEKKIVQSQFDYVRFKLFRSSDGRLKIENFIRRWK